MTQHHGMINFCGGRQRVVSGKTGDLNCRSMWIIFALKWLTS